MAIHSIIFIDDDDDLRDSFKGAAIAHELDVIGFSNLQNAKEYLAEHPNIKFAILDAKCFVDEGQEKGTEDIDFLMLATKAIEEISKENKVKIPLCIYTGFAEFKDKFKRLGYQIFEKAKDEEKMFRFILHEISQLDDVILAEKYPVVFDFAAHYFNTTNYQRLIGLLKDENHKRNDKKSVADNLATIRVLSEHLMDKIAEEILNKHPDEIGPTSGKRMLLILDAINPTWIVPDFLSHGIKNLYYTCSKYGNHNPNLRDLETFTPNAYTVETLINTLFAFIVWIDENVS